MLGLVLEELVLLLPLLRIHVSIRGASLINRLDLALQLDDLAGLFLLLCLEHLDLLLKIGLAMLSLQLLTHRECHRAIATMVSDTYIGVLA